MARKPVPADEAEFRKVFSKAKKKILGVKQEIRRRRNRNALWEI